MSREVKDFDRLEAIMCIWEHVLHLLNNDTVTPQSAKWKDWVQGVGYSQLRYEAATWLDDMLADWAVVEDTYHGIGCFDWDFVPAWIDANVCPENEGVKDERIIPGNPNA